jgi:cold shock CspA family protein
MKGCIVMRSLGKVRWFGGKHDFGYISPIGDHEEVRVHRKDLECPETEMSEGTAVTFELTVYGRGRPTATLVRLLRMETDIEVLLEAIKEEDLSMFVTAVSQLKNVTIPAKSEKKLARAVESRMASLPFQARTSIVRLLPKAIMRLSKPLRQYYPPVEHLLFCLNNPPPGHSGGLISEVVELARSLPASEIDFWEQLPSKYYELKDLRQYMSVERHADILSENFAGGPFSDYLAALRSALSLLTDGDKPRFLNNTNSEVLLKREAKDLRRWLPYPRLLELCGLLPQTDWLHDEVADLLAAESPCKRLLEERPWKNVEGVLKYQSSLYNRAPPAVQRKVIYRHFNRFFDAVKGATDIPHFTWEWTTAGVLEDLNDADKQLAACWANLDGPGNADHTLARMLSARAAEKVALNFYRQFSLPVEDISCTQLQGSSEEWKLYDLMAGQRPIDVKNARVPVNNRQTYVEHCIPRFKQARGQDVKIAAVVSPWVRIDQFQGTSSLWSNVVPCRFIGEADRHGAEQLERSFADLATRASTTIITVAKSHEGSANVLPPWLFDYPDFFYRSRDQSREWLLRVSEDQLPSLDDLKLTGINPLPAFLGAHRPLPPSWLPLLSHWQREFYDRVQHHPEPVSLPRLYLHLLLHFLEVSQTPGRHSDYSPEGYRDLLYQNAASGKAPVGVVDPLSVICTLLDALNTLWHNRDVIRLHDFQSFCFRGEGILSGRKKGTTAEVRILAYCGGRVPGKGKCGNAPLLIGREGTCDGNKCGYLICDKCKSCKSGCAKGRERRGDEEDADALMSFDEQD